MKKDKYPEEVQLCIDFLSNYKENPKLDTFNIFHMYPKEIAYPDGYYDSRFFTLVCFNESKMEKRTIENRDGLYFYLEDNFKLNIIRIFADGSTLIKFHEYVGLDIFQSCNVRKIK